MVTLEPRVRTVHLECRKNLGSSPSSGEAEKDDDCSDGRFVRTAPLPPHRKTQNRSLIRMILGFFFLQRVGKAAGEVKRFFTKNGEFLSCVTWQGDVSAFTRLFSSSELRC